MAMLAESGALDGVLLQLAADTFWRHVWPRIKDERLRLTVWFLRPSVRVAALYPLFVRIFGEPPA